MNMAVNPDRFRGPAKVRSDGSTPTAILEQMNKAFESFKANTNKELEDLKAGKADVVQTEKVDRINSEVTDLQKALDETNATLAALRVGGGGTDTVAAEVAEHSKVFNSWFRKGDRAIDADLNELEVNAGLTTVSDPDGGFLVPEQVSGEIDRVVGTVSVMRDVSNVMQIEGNAYEKLINMGGTKSGWVDEKDERPETGGPTLQKIVVNLMELYANPAATQRMLDDARLDIAAWLADEVSVEFAEQEGAAYIKGNGVNKPRGILGYDTVANADYKWGKVGFIKSGKANGFLAPTAEDSPADALISTYFGLKQAYRNGASWLMSDATMEAARKFKNAEGDFIFALPTAAAELPTILNKPVRTDDNMDAVGAGKFPIAFGNFQRGYLIVDKFGVRVLRDPFSKKPYVHFYTTKRTGGGIVNFEAIKLLKIAA
ncbi:phage major capsid protein [Phaeobacter sp. NW0010-22]|uniref:phage major capsid protein n=1 Tax=Phaeobacter sp. NW0010-22 TaxID=3135907 RepID=UPI0031085B36